MTSESVPAYGSRGMRMRMRVRVRVRTVVSWVQVGGVWYVLNT